jgi:hypothetical protein
MRAILILALLATGCATTSKPITTTHTVEVPRYIKQPVAPALTAPIVVDKPKAACNDGTGPVLCNGQLSVYRQLLEAAVGQCNVDRKAIRDGQGD